jgi:hypothetical protein
LPVILVGNEGKAAFGKNHIENVVPISSDTIEGERRHNWAINKRRSFRGVISFGVLTPLGSLAVTDSLLKG